MNKQHLARYGLKFNPFTPELPTEALYVTDPIDAFCWRIEHAFIGQGGFALISGEPGTGKSVALRILADRLNNVRDIHTGVITHPSSNLADFYREMGDVFAVSLIPSNRWGGFKALRERWLAHLESTSLRPVLLIDEAQDMPSAVLNELRLLTSAEFDSKNLLSVVLVGDGRLNHKLRREELLPLGSRIRTRLIMEHVDREQLQLCLKHLINTAGAPALISEELIDTLCDRAVGNYRILCAMAAELLAVAAKEKRKILDEKLFLDVYGASANNKRKSA